jgi:TDG/mug DNA glycosylase family protein
MQRIHSFAPIEDADATVLVLGSIPGNASLAAGEYYAHQRNHFWPIMGELVGAHPEFAYRDRLKILRSSGIALWDVLESCVRKTSLDSGIETDSEVPNEFNAFFLHHPGIAHVFFNGAKAEQCFLKHVRPSLNSATLHFQRLPSTSPANAGISYQQKLLAWQTVRIRSIESLQNAYQEPRESIRDHSSRDDSVQGYFS